MNADVAPTSNDPIDDYGVQTAPETLRIERILPGPLERVWAYVVEPDKRKLWFADGTMDLRVGGQVSLIWRNSTLSTDDVAPPARFAKDGGVVKSLGTVTACEPPHLLIFTWGEDWDGDAATEATFELSTHGRNVLLAITHRRLRTMDLLTGVSAGWHTHLAVLRARLEGVEPPKFWATFAQLKAVYTERLKP